MTEASTPTRTLDVCAVADLPDGEVAVVEDGGLRIAVFAVDGAYHGIEDECSHQQAWLSEGFLEGCAVECPLHSSVFDLRTGVPGGPPARAALRVFAASAVGDRVVVHLPG